MRILLLGGTGFLGAAVTRRLHEAGHTLAVFHRGETEPDLPGAVQHVHGDRDEMKYHRDALRTFDPEVVIDTAPTKEADAERTLGMFRGRAQRVVALSSGDVYRNYSGLQGKLAIDPDPVPLGENAPLRSTYYPYRDQAEDEDDPLYRYDKLLVERAYRSAPDLPATILRLPMLYGPGDPQRRLWPYVKRMLDGRPAILLRRDHASWRTSRGFVENVAQAVVTAVLDERTTGHIYNLGEELSYSEASWVERVGTAMGWDGEVVTMTRDVLPAHLAPDFDTSYDLVLDTTRFRDATGYAEPVDLDAALRRATTWAQNHPPADDATDATFDYDAEDAALAAYRG
jgi:nucleoside-diphosphate-sugar epimerase